MTLTINQYPETLAVVRFGPGADLPAWAESSSILSVTATATETSVVCAARNVPKKSVHQRGFTGFALQGPLDFGEVGILAGLLTAVAEEKLSAFVLSTYDTDWILIRTGDAERAAEAWRRCGHTVQTAVPVSGEKKKK